VERVDAVSSGGRDSSAGRGVYSGGAGTRTTVEGGKYGSRDERDTEMGYGSWGLQDEYVANDTTHHTQ